MQRLLLLVAIAARSGLLQAVDTADENDMISLLQHTLSKKVRSASPAMLARTYPGICTEAHPLDSFRPIPTVLAEHPETNGNCYFKPIADYLGDSPEYDPLSFKYIVSQFTPSQNGMEATILSTTGDNLTTHLDNIWGSYPYDDGMCYAEGWLKGQSLDGLDFSDTSAMYERAGRDCEKMRQRNNWTGFEREVTAGTMAFDNERIMHAAECSAGQHAAGCTPATLRDYDLHLYPKCLLGGSFTLTTQMVWCYARACLLEGNLIKHGMECYPDGLPAWTNGNP